MRIIFRMHATHQVNLSAHEGEHVFKVTAIYISRGKEYCYNIFFAYGFKR